MRKILIAIIVLLAVSLPLLADVTVSGEALYGFTIGVEGSEEEKGEAKVSVAGMADDWCTATVDIKVAQDRDTFNVDKALIEVDMLGAFGLDIPVTVTWMAGYFDSGIAEVANPDKHEMVKGTYDKKLAKDWELGVSIGILDMVTIKGIIEPEYDYVGGDQIGFFVGASGGYQWIMAEVFYTNATFQTTDTNDDKGVVGFGVGFDSKELLMGGDMGIKVGGALAMDLIKPKTVIRWGAGVGFNYQTWITATVGLNGQLDGGANNDAFDAVGIYLGSQPLDLLGIDLAVALALDGQSGISILDKFEAGLSIYPGAAQITLGYVFIPKDNAGAPINQIKGDVIAYKENRVVYEGTAAAAGTPAMGGGFFVQTKLEF
jgi:hypothetical protein